jgi:hypothetical protein
MNGRRSGRRPGRGIASGRGEQARPVMLKMSKLRRLLFETGIIERYRRREASV